MHLLMQMCISHAVGYVHFVHMVIWHILNSGVDKIHVQIWNVTKLLYKSLLYLEKDS